MDSFALNMARIDGKDYVDVQEIVSYLNMQADIFERGILTVKTAAETLALSTAALTLRTAAEQIGTQ